MSQINQLWLIFPFRLIHNSFCVLCYHSWLWSSLYHLLLSFFSTQCSAGKQTHGRCVLFKEFWRSRMSQILIGVVSGEQGRFSFQKLCARPSETLFFKLCSSSAVHVSVVWGVVDAAHECSGVETPPPPQACGARPLQPSSKEAYYYWQASFLHVDLRRLCDDNRRETRGPERALPLYEEPRRTGRISWLIRAWTTFDPRENVRFNSKAADVRWDCLFTLWWLGRQLYMYVIETYSR